MGCGTGYWLAWPARRGYTQLAGLDASMRMLAAAACKVDTADLRHGDASSLRWPTASFDRVLCVNALHHFTDKPAFVREAHRVLAASGGLIAFGLDPHVGADRWVVYDMFDDTLATDRRRYPPTATIRAWMTSAGFARAETFVAMHLRSRMPARVALDSRYLDRSATSQLTLLDDVTYEAGIARIEQRIDAAQDNGDVFEIRSELRAYATVGWVT